MLRYKACRNSLVTLELLNDSVTNEKRDDVVDGRYAGFRCNMAKVVNIVNVKTGETMVEDVSIYDDEFKYRVGEIVKTFCFNETINTVCTEGIHYFKTKEAALSWFYNQEDKIPDGKWIRWHENGQKKSEGTFKDGKSDGKFMGWHNNGQKHYEGTFKNGQYGGEWIYWRSNGNIQGRISKNVYGKWIYSYNSDYIQAEGRAIRKASHLDEP